MRQLVMKVWRRGFMRCRRREGPWGSHHVEARREKWVSSVGSTEVVDGPLGAVDVRMGWDVENGELMGGFGMATWWVRVGRD